MAIEIKFSYIPVNAYTGAWAPAHQTAARHHLEMYGIQCYFVEVSEEQFLAAIKGESRDIVTEAKSDCAGQIYVRYSARFRADDVGRSYSDGNGGGVFLLSVEFADRHKHVLTELSEQAQITADAQRERQRC